MIKKALKFFNLIDEAGTLSYSNSVNWILLTLFVYLAFTGKADASLWPVVAALGSSFVNYAHKRMEINKSKEKSLKEELIKQNETLSAELAVKSEEISKLKAEMKGHADVAKAADRKMKEMELHVTKMNGIWGSRR